MCFGGGSPSAGKVKPAPVAPPVVTPMDADVDAKKAGDKENTEVCKDVLNYNA